MTILEFKFEDLVISDLGDISHELFLPVICETCFFVPVKLVINGVSIFQHTAQSDQKIEWINLPAFGLIIDWKKIDDLPKAKKQTFFLADAGQMIVTYENGLVRVGTNINDLAVEENHLEFRDGVRSGIKTLMENLKSIIPNVFQNQEIRQELKLN